MCETHGPSERTCDETELASSSSRALASKSSAMTLRTASTFSAELTSIFAPRSSSLIVDRFLRDRLRLSPSPSNLERMLTVTS